MFTTIKKLTRIKKLDCSLNGNPNYMLYFGPEVVRTPKDSMLAYKISDAYLNKECQVTYYYNDKEQAFLKDIEKLD